MVDEAVGAEDIQPNLVRVGATLAVPLFGDDSRITVGIQTKFLVGGWQHISENLAPNLRRNAKQRRKVVQGSNGLWYGNFWWLDLRATWHTASAAPWACGCA